MNENIRKALRDMGHEDAATITKPCIDEAIVGVSDDGRVIYDFNKAVLTLMNLENLTEEEAVETASFIAAAATEAGDTAPIIMHPIWMQ